MYYDFVTLIYVLLDSFEDWRVIGVSLKVPLPNFTFVDGLTFLTYGLLANPNTNPIPTAIKTITAKATPMPIFPFLPKLFQGHSDLI